MESDSLIIQNSMKSRLRAKQQFKVWVDWPLSRTARGFIKERKFGGVRSGITGSLDFPAELEPHLLPCPSGLVIVISRFSPDEVDITGIPFKSSIISHFDGSHSQSRLTCEGS